MSRQDSRKGRAPVLALLLALTPMVNTAWAAEHEVQILKYTFTPGELTTKPGDTVTWLNASSASNALRQ